MSENDIINALKLHNDGCRCSLCPYKEYGLNCLHKLAVDALDLINRQQAEIKQLETVERFATKTIEKQSAEIERLQNYNENLQTANTALSNEILEIKSEAIKELAERLKKSDEFWDCIRTIGNVDEIDCVINTIDNLVKEMKDVSE